MIPEPLRPALFLDRDGTLVVEREGALRRPEEIELIPGAAAAVARLNAAGMAVVLATNQAAIARGTLAWDELERVHAELLRRLAQDGAHLDLVLVCPHHESEGEPPYRRRCACRKPEPGLLLEAAARLSLDLARSWMVGDAERDLAAAARAGVRAILVRTGKGERELARLARGGREPPRLARDLSEAADIVLGERGRSTPGRESPAIQGR